MGNSAYKPTAGGGNKAELIDITESYTSTGDTTENSVFSAVVPGGSFGSNGMLKVSIPISAAACAGTGGTGTLRLKYGGSTIHTTTITFGAIGGGVGLPGFGLYEVYISNDGSVSAQDISGGLIMGLGGNPETNTELPHGTLAAATSAVNTLANQTLQLTIQKSASGVPETTFMRGEISVINP